METEKEVEVTPLVEHPTETGIDIKLRRTESVYPMEKEIEYEMKCDFNCDGCQLLTKFFGLS